MSDIDSHSYWGNERIAVDDIVFDGSVEKSGKVIEIVRSKLTYGSWDDTVKVLWPDGSTELCSSWDLLKTGSKVKALGDQFYNAKLALEIAKKL